jgi:hypothetical protein
MCVISRQFTLIKQLQYHVPSGNINIGRSRVMLNKTIRYIVSDVDYTSCQKVM